MRKTLQDHARQLLANWRSSSPLAKEPHIDLIAAARGQGIEIDSEAVKRDEAALWEGAQQALEALKAADSFNANFYSLMSLRPQMQRILFIHIPKCGGTSMRRTLVQDSHCAAIPVEGVGAVGQSIRYMVKSVRPRGPEGQLLHAFSTDVETGGIHEQYLRTFAAFCHALDAKRVFILGHKPADELLPLWRPEVDLFMTVVREPAAMLKSLAAYRVSQAIAQPNAPTTAQTLRHVSLKHDALVAMATDDPKALTERLLRSEAPSLCGYLAFDNNPAWESVLAGLKERKVFISHMKEQSRMQASLMGGEIKPRVENSSSSRKGIAADFSAAVSTEWTEPFVDDNSRTLYERLVNSGIIGFWEKGGTAEQYQDLLAQA